jgi:ABC-2 type transport system permease protein
MDLGGVGTADYMLPGVILMCILSGIAYTAFRLNIDVTKGIFERFHSMPLAKSSILGGHVLSSLISNAVSVLAIILIGLLVDFRPQAGLVEWLLAAGLILLFIAAMTWMSVFFGLLANSPETAGVFSYLLIGLAFVSSSFVPVDTMPTALGVFARYQPLSPIADSVRQLLLGQPTGSNLFIALAWCVVIGATFWALSLWIYQQKRR